MIDGLIPITVAGMIVTVLRIIEPVVLKYSEELIQIGLETVERTSTAIDIILNGKQERKIYDDVHWHQMVSINYEIKDIGGFIKVNQSGLPYSQLIEKGATLVARHMIHEGLVEVNVEHEHDILYMDCPENALRCTFLAKVASNDEVVRSNKETLKEQRIEYENKSQYLKPW